MRNNETVEVTAYLQLKPTSYRSGRPTTPEQITGMKVIGITQKRSQNPQPGTVEVKLELRVPRKAFLPLLPSVVVEIPDSLTQAHPVEVSAVDGFEESE